MHTARSRPALESNLARAAWNRRRAAAWIDYLQMTRSTHGQEYAQVESNAWEQLQRRLTRNDELLEAGAQ